MKFYLFSIVVIFALLSTLHAQERQHFINDANTVLLKAGTAEKQCLFLFDTGCQLTMVSAIYDDSTYKVIGSTKNMDAFGNTRVYPIIEIPHFYIGSLHFRNVKAILNKDLWVSAHIANCKESLGGILGGNILSQYNWELNLVDTTYRASVQAIQYPDGLTLKLSIKKNMPYISKLSIEGCVIKNILFDTGDVNDIHLSANILNKLFSTNVYTQKWIGRSLNDSIHKIYSIKYYKGSVNILSGMYPMIVIGETSPIVRMGLGIFEQAVVAINYTNKTICINKGMMVSWPKKYVGIAISYEDGVAKISSTLQETESQYPALILGTVIKEINGIKASAIAAMTLCERSKFLDAVDNSDMEIITVNDRVYKLPAIY